MAGLMRVAGYQGAFRSPRRAAGSAFCFPLICSPEVSGYLSGELEDSLGGDELEGECAGNPIEGKSAWCTGVELRPAGITAKGPIKIQIRSPGVAYLEDQSGRARLPGELQDGFHGQKLNSHCDRDPVER